MAGSQQVGVTLRAVLAWLALAAICQAEANDVPTSRDYVIDTAHVVDPAARRAMDGWLQELQEKTGAQVKVLTVRTTGGEDFFTFVERQFEHWKLGRKGKDDGALIALAVDDHRVRIHTGYGLEGVLPDSWCGSLSREAAQSYFRAGRWSDGLVYIVKAAAFRVAEEHGVKLSGIPNQVHHGQQAGNDWLPIVIFIVILLVIFYFNYRSGSGISSGPMWMGPTWTGGGGRSSGGSWGGSFGGGGWGGGSFGGGSFGGGGMTGGGGGGASW
jgi:uncharacterized protein